MKRYVFLKKKEPNGTFGVKKYNTQNKKVY